MRAGQAYTLRVLPAVRLTIRAVYPDGRVKGTISVPGAGVIGTAKIAVERVSERWERA